MHEQDPALVLDFLSILALSGADYKSEFDPKSVIFIDSCLNLVEQTYKAMKTIEVSYED